MCKKYMVLKHFMALLKLAPRVIFWKKSLVCFKNDSTMYKEWMDIWNDLKNILKCQVSIFINTFAAKCNLHHHAFYKCLTSEGNYSWHYQDISIPNFLFLFWSINISPILRKLAPVKDQDIGFTKHV